MPKPRPVIELLCSAQWISHVAETQQEATGYAMQANQWWSQNPLFPCLFDEYVPRSAFRVEFKADRSLHGRWAVYLDCAWVLSTHLSLDAAFRAAENFYCSEGVCRAKMERLVFGRPFVIPQDPEARPLMFLELELAVFTRMPRGSMAYVIRGVKGNLTICPQFQPEQITASC